jgi:hypothetical protein
MKRLTRFDTLDAIAAQVMRSINKHSRERPISQAEILAACVSVGDPAAVHDAVERLYQASYIGSMRHTKNEVTQWVYWPTGLKPVAAPKKGNTNMASEPKNSILAKLILLHGPIPSAELSQKAEEKGINCPTKNIQVLLGGQIGRNEIIMRKKDGAVWYMTPNQADEWDENERAAGEDRDGAHVMSTPPAESELQARMLARKVADLEADIAKQRTLLAAKTELIVDLEERLQDAQRGPARDEPGRLALLLIDSAELMELEELDSVTDVRIAQAAAMARIDQGHAARAVVVALLGEARRQVAWKVAA